MSYCLFEVYVNCKMNYNIDFGVLSVVIILCMCVCVCCDSNDGTEFSGSVYHSIHRDLEFGVQFSWSAGANVSRFAVGTRYSPDFQTTYRVSYSCLCILH